MIRDDHFDMCEVDDATLVSRLLDPIWREVRKTSEQDEFEGVWQRLSTGQRVLFSVSLCESEVCNGGFHQLFYNSSGDLADHALDGLGLIGAPKAAAVLGDAMALFPHGEMPEDRGERMDALESVDVEALRKLDERFYSALREEPLERPLAAFARRNPDQFLHPTPPSDSRDALVGDDSPEALVGRVVEHPKFGSGTIIEVSDERLHIEFTDRTRKLSRDWLNRL